MGGGEEGEEGEEGGGGEGVGGKVSYGDEGTEVAYIQQYCSLCLGFKITESMLFDESVKGSPTLENFTA